MAETKEEKLKRLRALLLKGEPDKLLEPSASEVSTNISPRPTEVVPATLGVQTPQIQPDRVTSAVPVNKPEIYTDSTPLPRDISAPVLPQQGITQPVPEQNRQLMEGSSYIPNRDPQTSADYQENIAHVSNKDYSVGGKDRKKNWSTMDKLLGILAGFGLGLQGGLGGGIATAIAGGTDRNFFKKMQDRKKLARWVPQQQQAREQEQFELGQTAKQAQIGQIEANTEYTKQRPQIEKDKIQSRFDAEAQRQANRIAVLYEKDRLEGKDWDIVSQNGKFYKKFQDRIEPLINASTGEQERDLLNEPVEATSEGGQKGYAKFSSILNADAQKAYRDSLLALSKEKFEHEKKEDKIGNDFKRQDYLLKYAEYKRKVAEFRTKSTEAFAHLINGIKFAVSEKQISPEHGQEMIDIAIANNPQISGAKGVTPAKSPEVRVEAKGSATPKP